MTVMSSAEVEGLIRFSLDDLSLFSEASQDRNPLHLSGDYARKTPYGEPVVFGVLGGIACLGRLIDRPGLTLSNAVLEFPSPMFVGIDYRVKTTDLSPEQASARIYDGDRVLLKASFRFTKGSAAPAERTAAKAPVRLDPSETVEEDLVEGFTVSKSYWPAWSRLGALYERFGLMRKGVEDIHLAALMWCSYLVGMELPGRRALFSRLAIDFQEPSRAWGSHPAWEAKVVSFDKRFDLVRIEARLSSGESLLARAELRSFVRRDLPPLSIEAVESLVPRSDALKGKVGLVIGASRGLGAAIASGLALGGCTVFANFLKSEPEARRLKSELTSATGEIILLQGDGSELRWCEEAKRSILRDYKRLDFLVCSACPALLPLWLDSTAVTRINEYVTHSLALASVPMSVFLGALAENCGCCVIISSVAVNDPPAEWPHYVSAKQAVEGLAKVAAVEYNTVNFLIVRPPRLVTDLTNTPLGRQGAIRPERVAAKIVKHMAGRSTDRQVETLDSADW